MANFFAGQIPTAQQLDDTALVGTMVLHVRQLVVQSLSSGTVTPITWDTEDYDILGGHSTVTNPSRYTVQREGWYTVSGAVSFASNGTGPYRASMVRLNGSNLNAGQIISPPVSGQVTIVPLRTYTIYCVVGDYIEGCAQQSSGGGSLNTDATATTGSNMQIVYSGLPN